MLSLLSSLPSGEEERPAAPEQVRLPGESLPVSKAGQTRSRCSPGGERVFTVAGSQAFWAQRGALQVLDFVGLPSSQG